MTPDQIEDYTKLVGRWSRGWGKKLKPRIAGYHLWPVRQNEWRDLQMCRLMLWNVVFLSISLAVPRSG